MSEPRSTHEVLESTDSLAQCLRGPRHASFLLHQHELKRALAGDLQQARCPRLSAVNHLWRSDGEGHRRHGNRWRARSTTSATDEKAARQQRHVLASRMDATLTCTPAQVAGLLDDVAAMLAPVRRCLTMANGYPVAALRTEAAFTRHAADPRVHALAVELAAAAERAAAMERARATRVSTGR